MNLKRIQHIIENFSSRMNGVCDNYNFPDALKIGGLIYATSYSKQFGFSSHDINCVMNHFDDLFVMNIDMYHKLHSACISTTSGLIFTN